MKIAGVSVNLDNLPGKLELIRMALNTKSYINNPDALELINKEIKDSGLYRNIPKGNKKPNKSNTKDSK